MIATATQHATIRIVASYSYRDFAHMGGEVDYLGERFVVDRNEVLSINSREHTALIELVGHIIRRTGKASALIGYKGHALRVHDQQIRLEEAQ